MRSPTRLTLAAILAAGLSLTAAADERSDAAKKQKAAAAANLKAADLKAAHVETADLLVYAAVPEAKTKPLATALQQTFTVAAKALKVDSPEKLWPGKLTVYILPDSRQYKGFVLSALKRPAAKGETYALELRAEPPFVLAGMELGEKPTDAQVTETAAGLVASAVLSRHVGTGSAALPEPLLLGFGKAASMRTGGSTNRLATHRRQVRALYTKTQGKAFKLDTVTSGQTSPDTELVGTSLAEFLAFGPGAGKFQAVLNGLKPSDDNRNPTLQLALAAAEWKPEEVEPAWQKWVYTGK
jgi:hypothetical protein